MRMNHILLSSLVAGLLFVAPVISAKAAAESAPSAPPAGNEWRGPRGGHPFMDLSPEKRTALTALAKEHREKTFPIREQLWAKATTLNALQNNPKMDPQQVTALVNEMTALRGKLHTERLAFESKVKKELGIDLPAGMGGGMGMGGGCGAGMQGGMGKHGGWGGHRGAMGNGGYMRGSGMGMQGS